MRGVAWCGVVAMLRHVIVCARCLDQLQQMRQAQGHDTHFPLQSRSSCFAEASASLMAVLCCRVQEGAS